MIRVRFAGIVAALAVPIAAAGTASAAPQARPSASMTPRRRTRSTWAATRTPSPEYSTGRGHDQNAIALVRNDTQGYITDYTKDTVAVLDTRTRKVVDNITVGTGAVDVVEAIRPGPDYALPEPAQTVADVPRGGDVWAGSDDDGHVFVVDTTTGTVTRTIDVGPVGPVSSIAFAADGQQAWVAGAGGVAVTDPDGNVITFLPSGSLFTTDIVNMGTVALNASGRYAFVENSTFPTRRARVRSASSTPGPRGRRARRHGDGTGDLRAGHDSRHGLRPELRGRHRDLLRHPEVSVGPVGPNPHRLISRG